MVVFGLRLTTFVTEVLARRFESRWFDDVCNVGRPPVARPGPATARRHRGRSLRRPPHQRSLVCLRMVRRVGSLSGQALPPPMDTPAVPSGPSNVVCFVVLRFGDAPMRVVTNVVNRRCFSCGFLIRCYKRRQSDGFFAENQGFWTQIDDVCNMSTRKGVQIASV